MALDPKATRRAVWVLSAALVVALGVSGYLGHRVWVLERDRLGAFGTYLDLAEAYLGRATTLLGGHLAGQAGSGLDAARADYMTFVRIVRPLGGYLRPQDSNAIDWLTVAPADLGDRPLVNLPVGQLRRAAELASEITAGAREYLGHVAPGAP